MKRIGVTYSSVLDGLWLKKKKILVETVEIASLSHLERTSSKTWTYHFRHKDPYDWRRGSLNLLKLEEVKIAVEKSKTAILKKKPKIISVHLGPAALEIGKDPIDNHLIGLSKPLSRNEVMERLVESLDYLTQYTEAIEIPLAVENLDYHSDDAYEYICELDFINELFKQNQKIYLLLDISHAEISAVELLKAKPKNRLEVTREYLKKLPLEKVIEIHINSPIWKDESPLDMHLPITEIEKELIRELLSLPNLQIINLECERKIEEQLKFLQNELKGK